MFYLIGLGLNIEGISQQGREAVDKCEIVYLESYTVDFPYSKEDLEKVIGKKTVAADRDFVESLLFLEKAREKDIALLVYGSPLMATTHITIIEEAKKRKIKFEIIHNSSIFDAVAETGLQLYKFGKIASMPDFEADSYIEIIKQNTKMGAHSLVLVDIGMEFEEALERLRKNIKVEKIVVCSQLGTDEAKIYYGSLEDVETKKVKKPFCFIVPGKLHFVEEEVLKENV